MPFRAAHTFQNSSRITDEAHVNTNSKEMHDDYVFYFSTSVTDDQRKKGEEIRASLRGRSSNNDKISNIEAYNIDAEKLGMAVVFN